MGADGVKDRRMVPAAKPSADLGKGEPGLETRGLRLPNLPRHFLPGMNDLAQARRAGDVVPFHAMQGGNVSQHGAEVGRTC